VDLPNTRLLEVVGKVSENLKRIGSYSNIENLEPDKWKGARKEQKFNPELIELGLL
jgi:hypothetical protein